ncbi:MAG: DUF5683 domain-containing protein [Leptospiraceae bacterium]|nr:DUF5683 domain-containing protein [Leptospiraceae bacterium]
MLTISTSLIAETIVMKDGTAKYGKLLTQNKDTVSFENRGGKEEIIKKKYILRITYRELNQEEISKIFQESKFGEVVLYEVPNNTPPELEIKRKAAAEKKQSSDPTKPFPTLRGALWRSAILPGWGQFYQDRKFVSGIFLFSFVASLGGVVYSNNQHNSNIKDYEYKNNTFLFSLLTTNSPELQFLRRKELNDQSSDLDKTSNRLQISGAVLGGIYLLNLLDVVIFRPRENLSIQTNLNRDQVGLSFTYQF